MNRKEFITALSSAIAIVITGGKVIREQPIWGDRPFSVKSLSTDAWQSPMNNINARQAFYLVEKEIYSKVSALDDNEFNYNNIKKIINDTLTEAKEKRLVHRFSVESIDEDVMNVFIGFDLSIDYIRLNIELT